MSFGGNPGPLRRMLYASAGLLAGLAVLYFLLFPFVSQGMSLIFGGFAVAGWVLLGIPVVVAVPARFVSALRWPFCLLAGVLLGPLSLALVFLVIFALQRDLRHFSLDHLGLGWLFSVVVSAAAFLVYAGLLKRHTPRVN